MSFANELQKLKSLRDSGGITREEYEASRNRLLEECVRRIESVHDRSREPVVTVSRPAQATNIPSQTIPQGVARVQVPGADAAPPTRSSTYSEELDYSLVKPPPRREQVFSDADATARSMDTASAPRIPPTGAERGQPAVSSAQGVPRVKFSSPPFYKEPGRSGLPTLPGQALRSESAATAAAPAPSPRVAYETVKINPPAPRVDDRQRAASTGVSTPRPEFSAPPQNHALDRGVPKPATPSVQAFQVENRAPEAPLQRPPVAPYRDPDAGLNWTRVSPRSQSEQPASWPPPADDAVKPVEATAGKFDAAIALVEAASSSPVEAEEVSAPAVEEALPKFATSQESEPAEKSRWGLPRFKLVTGVVQDVRLSMCQNSEAYAASVSLDGQRMEITSSSEIRIAAGDRVNFGGYERDGQLLVLGYRNESNGSHSDLDRLRKRYRFLLTLGRLSLLVGLAALAATVMLFLHQPMWASRLARWGHVPYALSGVAAAAVSYLGLALSFVGRWAKDFHSALAPPSRSVVPQNPPSPLPATY